MARALRQRPRHRRGQQGDPGRRRVDRHDQEALRLHRRGVDRGEPALLPQPAVHGARHGGLHRRRDPLRRDDSPVVGRRHAVRRAARVEGRRARHQGGHGREGACAAPRRDRHRGPRRVARAAGRVPRARRTLRQVARGDHDRRRHPDRSVPPLQRARAGALRGAVPGGRAGADRRARGADGRRPHDRDVRRRDRADSPCPLRRALRPGRPPAGHAAQAQHGDRRQGLRRPRTRRRGSPR